MRALISLSAMIDLGGIWQAHIANDELRRVFTDPAFDTKGWHELVVPGHWRSNAAFIANDAPLLIRTTFTAAPPVEGRRSWLRFAGVFYQGDVWLDGTYIGDTEGYFCPHEFEITEALATGPHGGLHGGPHGGGGLASTNADSDQSDHTPVDHTPVDHTPVEHAPVEHTLAVEVTCAPQPDRKSKRNLTGVFQHWDCIHPDWNPGGIWQPVTIEESGPVSIGHFRAVCTEASTERAEVLLRVVVNATEQQTITLRTNIGGTLNDAEHRVAKGDNRIEWRVTVERPKLWWPHSLGTPTMTDLSVAVVVGDDEVSDSRELRIGLRQVRMKNYIFEINGERLHLKGANLGPTRMAIGEATPTELAHDLALAKEAGLNLIRLHAHISHPAIYDAADELGMCIWQDMPLQWGYARSVRKQAVRQAREAVDLLGHHPSVITWCGHNEPLAIDLDPADLTGSPKRLAEMAMRYFALQELPTWNKSVLDFGIHRALSSADPSRPVTAHSGILPGPLSGGTDSHLYFGWYHGKERDLPKFFGRFPRMARFVSEFGAQAVPTRAEFCEPENWPYLDWANLGRNHSLQKTFFDKHVPPAQYETFAQWQHATQAYQAELLRRAIEEMRRIKYKPNGGFALFSLADALDHPAVTWSILGHDRAPKLAFESVSEACNPVIVVADRLPEVVTVGDAFALDVHVVSDLRHPLRGGITSARLHWPGGEHSWRWQGDVGADTCVRVGAVNLLVPSPAHPSAKAHAQASMVSTTSAPAIEATQANQLPTSFTPDPVTEIFLDLTFEHPEATATNRYRARFV